MRNDVQMNFKLTLLQPFCNCEKNQFLRMLRVKKTEKQISRSKKHTSGRTTEELTHFKLGKSETEYNFEYSPALLEAFANKNPTQLAWTTFICSEFTSLCPKTAQPDFARVFINYIADEKMVESKSLKMYLFSFRNHGDFHEDCIQKICNDLFKLMKPHYIEVIGEFTPRGGISIFPFASESSNKAEFKKMKLERMMNYAPGKYTCSLSKLYGN